MLYSNARDDIRIGDTERREMADLLGKHYSDGRLDDVEFNERMERAMAAKTRGDLKGLLSDLPPLGLPVTMPTSPPRTRRLLRTVAVIGLVVMALFAVSATASIALHPWRFWHLPWLLFAIIAAVALWCTRGRRRHGGAAAARAARGGGGDET